MSDDTAYMCMGLDSFRLDLVNPYADSPLLEMVRHMIVVNSGATCFTCFNAMRAIPRCFFAISPFRHFTLITLITFMTKRAKACSHANVR